MQAAYRDKDIAAVVAFACHAAHTAQPAGQFSQLRHDQRHALSGPLHEHGARGAEFLDRAPVQLAHLFRRYQFHT